MKRPARERFAAHELAVDRHAIPGQRVALIPAPSGAHSRALRPRSLTRAPRTSPCASRRMLHWRRPWRSPSWPCRAPREPALRFGASNSRRNSPVCEPRSAATSSGVPAAITMPPSSPPSGPMSIKPVGALDDVEVVLDHHHAVAGVHEPLQHLRAVSARRRSAVPWWARRGCTACGRSPPSRARWRASRAGPHRLTASSRADRGGCSRGRPRRASPGAGGSWGCARRSAAPPRPASRAPRRCSCP